MYTASLTGCAVTASLTASLTGVQCGDPIAGVQCGRTDRLRIGFLMTTGISSEDRRTAIRSVAPCGSLCVFLAVSC